jgi:hypothetical protein
MVLDAADWAIATKPSMTSMRAVADLARASLQSPGDGTAKAISANVIGMMRDFIKKSEAELLCRRQPQLKLLLPHLPAQGEVSTQCHAASG